MAENLVAVTRVVHGEDDGSVTVYEPGDVVPKTNKDLVRHLYANGALAVEGSPDDPNTWAPDLEHYPTTPRVVEEALRAQARDLDGPDGEVQTGSLTQPHKDAPTDPRGLAEGTAKPGKPEITSKTAPNTESK